MYSLRNNATRAREIITVLFVLIGLSVLNMAVLVWQYMLLDDVVKHPLTIDEQTLTLSDNVRSVVAIANSICMIISVIYFIRWFRRAYFNLHTLPSARPEFSEGWAAGAWFVPFLNLVRPYQIMKEIWEGSQNAVAHRLGVMEGSGFIGLWWGAHLVSNIYSNVVARLSNDAATAEDLMSAHRLEFIGDVLSIVAAILAIQLIRKTAVVEQELYLESTEPTDSVFSNTGLES